MVKYYWYHQTSHKNNSLIITAIMFHEALLSVFSLWVVFKVLEKIQLSSLRGIREIKNKYRFSFLSRINKKYFQLLKKFTPNSWGQFGRLDERPSQNTSLLAETIILCFSLAMVNIYVDSHNADINTFLPLTRS